MIERTVLRVRGISAPGGVPNMMNAVPEGWKVVRCVRCREPINQRIRSDGQTETHCPRCTPLAIERQNRIDRIRAAAQAAQPARRRSTSTAVRR